MLERTRSYFEDVIAEDFNYLKSNIINSEKKRSSRTNRSRHGELTHKKNDFLTEEYTMTRKTRTRRPRVSALQSGYCAVCNIPYNSVEDHIQSKKHQKLIGEDANYIALNGSLNGFLQTDIPFLNLNGIDAIGVHDTSLDEFSPSYKKRTMRRNRAASIMCDPSPLSPAVNDITGHHLRSRRNINYMTPPLDDDSLQEKPDLTVREEHEQENKDTRELRCTTRSFTKLMSAIPEPSHEEVWNSGRPKRMCISKKRLSLDDRLTNCKTYYKVEVVSPKLRSDSSKYQETSKRQQSQSPKREEEKALIVKFKKLRNSELIQLNNEATNFLFPKKDETSEEEEEEEDDVDCNTTASSVDSINNLELEDCKTSTPRFKNEDETSMDSTEKKKKRRTHAEAFILDNQKYYKFETPGSRLRYQGSYLPMVLRSPERHTKVEEDIKLEEPEEKKVKYNSKVKLDNYKFAFEKVPSKMGWYNAFRRLDNAEQSYSFFSNYLWESFVLPYQMRTIHPLDRKYCCSHYRELLNCLLNSSSESNSRSSSPEPSESPSLLMYDEDSKLSASTTSSISSTEDKLQNDKAVTEKPSRIGTRQKVSCIINTVSKGSRGGKNPRKSPRQHASTLAILSGLIQHRKGRSKGKVSEEIDQNLNTIEEEEPPVLIQEEVKHKHSKELPVQIQEEIKYKHNKEPPVQIQEEGKHKNSKEPPVQIQEEVKHKHSKEPPVQIQEEIMPKLLLSTPPALRVQAIPTSTEKPKTPLRKAKPRIDYFTMARQIDEEFDSIIDDDLDLDDYEIEYADEHIVDFNKSKTTLTDILGLYEENNSKETEKTCRRFFNGPMMRKPGIRRKKLNKTGWPNKSKKPTTKKEQNKEKGDDIESLVDSTSVNDTDDDDDEDEVEEPEKEPNLANEKKESNLAKEKKEERPKRNIPKQKPPNKNVLRSNVECVKNSVNKSDKDKIITNREMLQPYVCVQKLDSKKLCKKIIITPKRTIKKQRCMPGSPKSPRMLRKPRGRWYRER